MKRSRKLSILLVFTLFVTLFTGCTMEDKYLADAFLKNQEILSFESTTNLDFKLSGQGLAEDEKLMFDIIQEVVNGLSIEMKQKSVSNEDQTTAKGYADVKVKLGDESYDTSIWVDVDMSGEELILKEIFKLPSIVTQFLPSEISGKKYISLDINEMDNIYEDLEESFDFNEVMGIAMKYQEKFVESIKKYIKNYDSNFDLVTKLKDQNINGETVEIYQVKFNNDSFKEFIKYNILSVLKDGETITLFSDYMSEVFAITGEEMPEEMDFTKNIPQLIESVQEFFEKIEKVNILGKDGIVIDYGINKDGYIISEKGKMDFLIDMEAITALVSDEEDEVSTIASPVYNLVISYDTKMTKINKDMEIYIPETTEMNSISFGALMETLMGSLTPEEDGEQAIIIFTEDDYVELTSEPLLLNDRMHVASRDIGTAIGAQVDWNGSTKEITVTKDDTVLVLKVDSDVAVLNGEELILDTKIVVVDGTGFVPLRFISESFGFEVEWDSVNRFISIYKD